MGTPMDKIRGADRRVPAGIRDVLRGPSQHLHSLDSDVCSSAFPGFKNLARNKIVDALTRKPNQLTSHLTLKQIFIINCDKFLYLQQMKMAASDQMGLGEKN